MDGSDLESVLQHQAALDQLVPQLVHRELLEPGQEEDGSWEEEALLRAQRGDPMARPLPPFPEGHSLESYHYQDGGEGEEGGKRNEALTSIIGGLQAVNREKGGFGFRFGRKRWTDRGWRDEGRGSSVEGQEGLMVFFLWKRKIRKGKIHKSEVVSAFKMRKKNKPQ